MSNKSHPSPPPGGQFLVYQAEDGKLKIEVRFQGETVWLTQQHMPLTRPSATLAPAEESEDEDDCITTPTLSAGADESTGSRLRGW